MAFAMIAASFATLPMMTWKINETAISINGNMPNPGIPPRQDIKRADSAHQTRMTAPCAWQ